jgi:SnoaL-like domain
MLLSSYWPGAIDDHVVWVGPVEDYVPWVMHLLESIALTQHNLGHSYFEMHGDVAIVETNFTAYHRVTIDNEERDIMLGARYVDHMEKRGGEWRIAHRILIQDWLQDMGHSCDWSQRALGMPFKHGRGVGRSHGDASIEFFGKLGRSSGA